MQFIRTKPMAMYKANLDLKTKKGNSLIRWRPKEAYLIYLQNHTTVLERDRYVKDASRRLLPKDFGWRILRSSDIAGISEHRTDQSS